MFHSCNVTKKNKNIMNCAAKLGLEQNTNKYTYPSHQCKLKQNITKSCENYTFTMTYKHKTEECISIIIRTAIVSSAVCTACYYTLFLFVFILIAQKTFIFRWSHNFSLCFLPILLLHHVILFNALATRILSCIFFINRSCCSVHGTKNH